MIKHTAQMYLFECKRQETMIDIKSVNVFSKDAR